MKSNHWDTKTPSAHLILCLWNYFLNHDDVIEWKLFRVTGPLCGEFTGHRWIPHTKASDAELWYFLLISAWINGWVNNRGAGDLRRHRAHYDVIVMHFSNRSIRLKYDNRKSWLTQRLTFEIKKHRLYHKYQININQVKSAVNEETYEIYRNTLNDILRFPKKRNIFQYLYTIESYRYWYHWPFSYCSLWF